MKKLNESIDLLGFHKKRLDDVEARLYVQQRYLQLKDDANIWLFNTRSDVANKIEELKKDRNYIVSKLLEITEQIKFNLINII